MQKLNIAELLDDALSKEYGMHITFSTEYGARYARRALYAGRERARENGNILYNSLSFIVRGNSLLVIKRASVATQSLPDVKGCRPLSISELPEKISSRGKSRVSIFIS